MQLCERDDTRYRIHVRTDFLDGAQASQLAKDYLENEGEIEIYQAPAIRKSRFCKACGYHSGQTVLPVPSDQILK